MATYNLMKVTDREQPALLFIQEPYELQNRLLGIDKKYRIFTAGDGKHTAAIIITNNRIDAILITKFSDEDTVFLEIIHENQKCFAASMYFDLEDPI
jgi:SAM-dependent MidA family methyltransferase